MKNLRLEISDFYDDLIRQADIARETFAETINSIIDRCKELRAETLDNMPNSEEWARERGLIDFNYEFLAEFECGRHDQAIKKSCSLLKSIHDDFLTERIGLYRLEEDSAEMEASAENNMSGGDIVTECIQACGAIDIDEYFSDKASDFDCVKKGQRLGIILHESYPYAAENSVDDLYGYDKWLKKTIQESGGRGRVQALGIDTNLHFDFGKLDEPINNVKVENTF